MNSFLEKLVVNADKKSLDAEIAVAVRLAKTVEIFTLPEWIAFATDPKNTASMKQYAILLALITMASYRKACKVTEEDLKQVQERVQQYLMGKEGAATSTREVMMQIRLMITTYLQSSIPKPSMQESEAPPPAGSTPVMMSGNAVLKT
jgi:hypothetical protein